MRRILWLVVVVAILVFVGSGCARYGTPPEVAETKALLEEARMAGAEQNCPQEFNAAWAAWEKVEERLCPCSSQKAKAQAERARVMAAQLCTDTDGDGVPDEMDQCPDTPAGVQVDAVGCALDSDGDGVNDSRDECPDTPKGVEVDAAGCPLDSDADGISDYLDRCPGTPQGAMVNEAGCWEIANIYFDNEVHGFKTHFKIGFRAFPVVFTPFLPLLCPA